MSTRRSAPRFVRAWMAAALGIGIVALGASCAYLVLFAIGTAVEGNPLHSPWSEARRDVMTWLAIVAAVTAPAAAAAMRRAAWPERQPRDLAVTRDPGPGSTTT